ncbi:MAG: 50S ribosomal protein L33 [bacterium (Candidatus Ratteibacteria) CG23_combo_of_CG06-09_8_20_14_all_48_7]|uniref:Large ribosomal subunit protein bL33 n=1 Tax=bacterium (Candidatus Ratteibacteria) CG23_combo_of_CG06-09_8_20_14_all_48_7 TaxID=2014292 RepID=A0A2G9Y885_9BACT|nr:MAG: 50S ribosomal protein L33 [bacterium (Candidatus Ratteibacteria) CG23_combo_of_CG06-09_8_20_14_all_48_7]
MRDLVTLECTECNRRNYNSTKDKKKQKERLQFRKYCSACRKHTLHKETK